MHADDLSNIRRNLPLPRLLVELITTGRWVHPGNDLMKEKIPFIRDPVHFLGSIGEMDFNSGPLMGRDAVESEIFSEYRGSTLAERDLPWIDVEKALFIIVNRIPGDDVGIALDYRPGLERPRIIGGDWGSGNRVVYREICPSFQAFVELLGL